MEILIHLELRTNVSPFNSHSLAIKEDCWGSGGGASAHHGNATLITSVTIAGETYEFKQHVNWDGDGASSQNNITKISQL